MTFVIGDIHGDVESLKKALALPGEKVFVGDFVDSFKYDAHDQIFCIEMIVEAIANGKARSVFGNHEVSYLLQGQECSGWNARTDRLIAPYKIDVLNKFETHISVNGWLITHAGVAPAIMESDGYKYLSNPEYFRIGKDSGGKEEGGPLWLRPSEFDAYTDKQIFGHTPHGNIKQYGEAYCIDTIQSNKEILEILGDGTVRVVKLA